MEHKYVRVTKGVKDKGTLVTEAQVFDLINDRDDWYQSVFYYNDQHLEQFKSTGSVRGIKDVFTNKLVFDFDSRETPERARLDAITLIDKLRFYNIKPEDLQIYFSGNKGYNVVIELDKSLTPVQCSNIAMGIGQNLETLDPSLYDAPQILRIPGTKHQESKLFKIPLTFKELNENTTEVIKDRAKSLDNISDEIIASVSYPTEQFFKLSPVKADKPKSDYKLDLTKKPAQWKNCKWSLLQGNFKSGERHAALMVIAATCRGLGYDKVSTYYLCKSALKKQAELSGSDEFSKEELWTNIIEESVFADGWEGGQYTCKNDPWLNKYCCGLGEHGCKDREEAESSVTLKDMTSKFLDYAVNFQKNVIKTGLVELDENATLVTSTLNGLLGQPGAGKTSMALNYLHNTSKNNIPSVFLSLDMGLPLVYGKLIQKMTGKDFKEVMQLFKENPLEAAKLAEACDKEYSNVRFNFRSGLTVQDIRTIVQENDQRIGAKTKLIVIDYLECLAGPYSDPTANTGFIANQLKDLANELEVCILLLLQTQKHSTPDIADPLLSLKQVKGSSIIEQSASTILTLWREGYNPDTVEDDKYISFAIVKNRFGSLWRGDFSWDGVRGGIRGLTEEEFIALKQFRRDKQDAKRERDEETSWR